MKRTIGRCSICGGEVQAHVGMWMGMPMGNGVWRA